MKIMCVDEVFISRMQHCAFVEAEAILCSESWPTVFVNHCFAVVQVSRIRSRIYNRIPFYV